MSFSSDVKERISTVINKCEYCNRAELSAIVRYSGRINNSGIVLTTENESCAKRMRQLIAENTGIDASYIHKEKSRLFEMEISQESAVENICDLLMLFDDDNEALIPFDCCAASYIRGAFLGGGSISDPKKSYHMEFDSRFLAEAERLRKVLNRFSLNCSITERKGHFIVYIKDYSTIADCLGVMGDSSAALEIYNLSVERELRNTINRQLNCESANMDKTADAYQKHIKAISIIKKNVGLDKLPDVLQEIARVRLEYPEDSLKQLGQRLEQPIGKSGVNHRLNRILEIAENSKDKKRKGK